jgi:hypothetical protein
VKGWRSTGFGIGCIDHLYTRLVTTSTYNAIADLHTLQITTAPVKASFQPVVSSAVPWQLLLTVEVYALRFTASQAELNSQQWRSLSFCDHAVASWLNLLTTAFVASTDLVITFRHGPHRKHCFSIVAFVSVASGTCLPSRCSATGVVSWPLPSNGSTRYINTAERG